MSTVRHTLLSASAAALAVTLLAACGSANSSGSANKSPSSGADAALSDVRADVEAASQPLDKLPIPTQPLPGTSSLSGKAVYYVPLTAQVRGFQLTGEQLGKALGTAGVDLQTCDGGSNPSQISACVNQAVGASAAAIVVDSIPYGMAANALDDARAKGIPVLVTNQIVDPQHPADQTLGYLNGPGTKMLQDVANWIITDSDGKATVVIQKSTDNPSTIAYAQAAEQVFQKRCPDCTVVINEVSAANFPLIASSTSAAILSHPNVGYVLSEFDHFLQPTIGGVQQSSRAASIKIASTAAQLSGLQMVQKGNLVHADAGQNFGYQGWADADAAFRLMLSQPLPEYEIPSRLLTADNIDSVDLTEEAEAAGEWYGPTDFQKQFMALWGMA